jgi:chemotaxis protein methyltransferase CheR
MMSADLGARLDLCASDLSEASLEKARSGLYTHFEVQRGLPISQLLRSFDKVEDAWRVRPELRQTVRWRRFNLLDDPAQLGRFDLIVCRNVVGEMDASARTSVLRNLAAVLAPDGVLVLGASETAAEAPDMFEAAPGGRGLYIRPRRAVVTA